MMVDYSARSHVGRVRKNNEDNLYVGGVILTPDIRERPFSIDGTLNQPAIFAVLDGMGGEDDGEFASLSAAESLSKNDRNIKTASSEKLDDIVGLYVNEINDSIRFEGSRSGRRSGTTLALAVIKTDGIFCYSIGDSRIYCLQNADFKQVSHDHTLFAEQMRYARFSDSIAADEKNAHKLTRCIGIGSETVIDSYPPITGSCRILICSDGLTDLVDAADIKTILRTHQRTADAADGLLSTALKNGGRDNTTIIVLDVEI